MMIDVTSAAGPTVSLELRIILQRVGEKVSEHWQLQCACNCSRDAPTLAREFRVRVSRTRPGREARWHQPTNGQPRVR
jgi:hypothetical protein